MALSPQTPGPAPQTRVAYIAEMLSSLADLARIDGLEDLAVMIQRAAARAGELAAL